MKRLWAIARAYPHEAAVGAYIATYLVLMALATPGRGILWQLSTWSFFVIGGATVWSQFQLGKRSNDSGARCAWCLLAVSSAALWIGGLSWTTILILRDAPAADSVSLLIEAGYALPALVGLLRLPRSKRFTWRDPRVLFDAALFGLGALALSWHFSMAPFLEGKLDLEFGILTILAEWGMAIAMSFAYLRAPTAIARRAIGFLLTGHLIYVLTDFFWFRGAEEYIPGAWVDVLWFTAWVFRWAGTRVAFHEAVPGANGAVPSPGEEGYRGGAAPAALVVCAYLLLVMSIQIEPERRSLDLAAATGAMAFLLLARQHFALTDRRRLANATATLAARFRSIAASAPGLVLVTDTNGRVAHASPAAERLLGARIGEQILDVVSDADRPAASDWLSRLSPDAASVLRCNVRSASGWRLVELHGRDLTANPLVGGVVLNGRDITSESALEADLGHARKLATLSEMAGQMAHAFNNALAVIAGQAERLRGTLRDNVQALRHVEAISGAADRCAGVTKQLLGFAEGHVTHAVALSPAAVIRDLEPTLRRLLPFHVDMTVQLDDNVGAVHIDRNQLEQVVVNLVTNARDAVADTGSVHISVRAEGEFVAVVVSDTGVGITADALPRIFEPFFTTKSVGSGTGLGLPMVSSIVQRAGGRVDVDSVPGRGSTFSVRLPRLGAEFTATTDAPVRSTRSAVANAAVLVVDDDAMVRELTTELLRREGFSVREAGSGAAALAIASDDTVRIDVLLTDLMMPVMSGRDLIERFRELRPRTPVVCFTGFAADREDAPLRALNVAAVVHKPFTIEALAQTLTTAVETG